MKQQQSTTSSSKKRSASNNRRGDPPSSSASSSKKLCKHRIDPVVPSKHSMYDLFGSDSENEEAEKRVDKQGNYSMYSYFTQKYSKAFSQQIHKHKQGKYYIVLKTYKVEEIENMQLSKLSCIDLMVKNRTDYGTVAWYHLLKFINVVRRQINKCLMFSVFDDNRADESSEFSLQDGVRKAECVSRSDSKKQKSVSTEYQNSKRASASDIFGSDSDEQQIESTKSGKKPPPIISSYFNKRVANGVSRQIDSNKTGTHFIELKLYNYDEIRNVQPMNRWRHAIITIKNQTDDDTKAWEHLAQFIKATRREFKDCRPDILSGCGAYS